MFGIILTFTAVSILLTIVPGPDTLLVLRAGIRGGRVPGIASAFGCAAGSLVWGSAAAVGIATLLQQSATAYEIVKLAGAVYLAILGIRALWSARRTSDISLDDDFSAASPRARTGWRAFLYGLSGNLLNPKMGLFYVAVIPQVVPHSIPVLQGTFMFAGIDTLIAALYMSGLAIAATWALHWLRQTKVRKAMEGATGLCMVGLGAGIALDHSI